MILLFLTCSYIIVSVIMFSHENITRHEKRQIQVNSDLCWGKKEGNGWTQEARFR